MQRQMLKSKIHHATVPDCDPAYIGSVTIDVVASYGSYADEDLVTYSPVVVHVDDFNRTVGVDSNPDVLLAGLEDRWADEVPGSLGTGADPLAGGLQ